MSALGRSSLVFLLIAGDQSAADFSHSELVCAQIRLLQGEFFFEREAQGDAREQDGPRRSEQMVDQEP